MVGNDKRASLKEGASQAGATKIKTSELASDEGAISSKRKNTNKPAAKKASDKKAPVKSGDRKTDALNKSIVSDIDRKPRGKTKSKKTSPKNSSLKKPASSKLLEREIDYHFKDSQLLLSALTHSSSVKPHQHKKTSVKLTKDPNKHDGDADNERLEFLGDRVLGLSISSALLKLYPHSDEGGLARRYNSLVRRKTCAEVALSISLGDYVILSSGEERSGGRKKSTILSNAMEALLGAIFIDGGYEVADKIIRQLWLFKIEAGQAIELDAKTALQEWAQGNGYELPNYVHLNQSGPDHNPLFEAEVLVEGVGTGRGEGVSKRIAEQCAAKDLLVAHKVWDSE